MYAMHERGQEKIDLAADHIRDAGWAALCCEPCIFVVLSMTMKQQQHEGLSNAGSPT